MAGDTATEGGGAKEDWYKAALGEHGIPSGDGIRYVRLVWNAEKGAFCLADRRAPLEPLPIVVHDKLEAVLMQKLKTKEKPHAPEGVL
jgi:hypothetical protein